MNYNQVTAEDSIRNIKKMMERSSKFLSLSGLAGVFAGIYALIGASVAYKILNWGAVRFQDYGSVIYNPEGNFLNWLLLDGIIVLLFSLVTAYYFTKRKATRLGTPMWDNVAKKLFINFITPLLVGGIFGLLLLYKYHLVFLIAPVTLIFYGLALVGAAKYSFDELRWLGYGEIILGLLSTLFIGYGLIFWAIGFGVLHIIYGIKMYQTHR